ncbi:oleandomycin glycosyltransferase [Aureimonas sp. SA4125]|uniref:nucleotide disphospho-sugar-binding domain-containing protein n=1 Tax=Aureimonas sp. SA4125 TaxID=2826993 RepID=UPI001CC7BC7C|nr:nucleotide disphospho-sugar-binding domain-containing protein [Aureimonas sp. SA4125]BDA86177.1 oleandomycin glycosyltransferase [Aureimonas sp. SA4125]
MAHYALICPPFYSHVRVFEALAEALAARGHRATFVLNAGGERLVATGGPGVVTTGPGGDLDRIIKRAAQPNGPLGILRTVADTAGLTAALCRDGPALLKAIGAEAIIGDQMEPAAGLLAAHLGLPLVSVACALPVNAAPGVPLPFLGWPYDPSPAGLKRNRAGEKVAAFLLRRQRRTIEAWAARFDLGRRTTMEDCVSPILQLSQCPAGLDFPRPPHPHFHAVGPIRKAAPEASLPFDIDPKRPFVFASLGTLQGHRLDIFKVVASACRRMGAQLLVAHCGGLSAAQAACIGADFVTDFAPQAAVLARADACMTHGGMNTVLDALQAAVPLLVIPIAFDQPGIGARVVHHGVGRMLPRRGLTPATLESALRPLIERPEATARAAWLGREIAKAGGATLAARLVEEATA